MKCLHALRCDQGFGVFTHGFESFRPKPESAIWQNAGPIRGQYGATVRIVTMPHLTKPLHKDKLSACGKPFGACRLGVQGENA